MCLASDLKTDCVSYGKDLCWAGDTVYEWSGWMALGWEELVGVRLASDLKTDCV